MSATNLGNGYANDSLHENIFVQQAPYHPFNEAQQGIVDNAYGVMAIPLPITRINVGGGDGIVQGPYDTGALSWDSINRKFQHCRKFETMLHLVTHALEFKGNGCPTFLGRPGSDAQYASIMAFLRALEHRATKADRLLLANATCVKQTLTVDQCLAETFRAIVSGELNDLIQGREDDVPGGANGYNEDDIVDGMDVEIPRADEGRRNRGAPAHYRDNDEDMEDAADAAQAQAETDASILRLIKDQMQGMEGVQVMEKIKLLVVHMTRPALDRAGQKQFVDAERTIVRMEDAGCVVFICIMDPLYSIGNAFHNLIEMCEEYRNAVTGMSAREGDSSMDTGNKRKWTPSGGAAANTRLVQNFPWITGPDHATNALLDLNMETYMDLVAFIRNDPTIMTTNRQACRARGMGEPGTVASPNLLHPVNVFTPEMALNIMLQYGVEPDQCDIDRFRGPALQRMEEQMANNGPSIDKWWFPPMDTYHYLLESWTWNRNGKAGLRMQYWPWAKIPAALKRLTSMRTESNAITIYDGDTPENVLSRDYTLACISAGMGVIMALPNMAYDPNAILRQSAIYQVSIENRRVMDELIAPRDPEDMLPEYKLYCAEMAELRDGCMTRTRQVAVPTAHVAPSFKLIFAWMAQNVKYVSTPLPMYTLDPFDEAPAVMPMDVFANYMAREALYVRYFRLIVAQVSHWQISHHGAMDCYSLTNVDMHICMIFHGISQSGKSFFAKDATVKTTVPGTVSETLESSNRAFNTHEDYTGVILFKDELENIYVDAKAAENDKSGKSERIKSMMTEQKCSYRVLTFLSQANGREKRVGEDIESLYHATMICSTNKKMGGGDEAIISRFLNFAITRAEVDLFEYLGISDRLDDLDRQRNSDFVKMLRVKQCLVAIVQALVDTCVIPDASMDVYDTLNKRMLAWLGEQGMDTQAVRGSQMTRRLARIYTLTHAIIQVYDRPGAIFEGVPYDLSQLQAITPYNYCTKQIALFAWTQTGEVYVHPMQIITIKAAFAHISFPYDQEKSIETYFTEDPHRQIRWRVENAGTPEECINPNYLCVAGDYAAVVLKNLAENSKPKVGENEIDSNLKALSKQFITVKPVKTLTTAFYHNLQPQAVPSTKLTREDIPRRLQVVVRNFSAKEIYIATDALRHYREDMLVTAFLNCIHDGFRPQKFLLGMQLTGRNPVAPDTIFQYTGIYQTLEVNQHTIQAYSMGPQFLFPDVTYMPRIVTDMLAGGRLDPDKSHENYEKNRKKRSKAVVGIDEDLDDWGYRMHHYRSAIPGKHVDGDGQQMAIYHEIRQAMLKDERDHDENDQRLPETRLAIMRERALMVDYPEELKRAEDARLVAVSHARNFHAQEHKRLLQHEVEKLEYEKLSPAERQRTNVPTVVTASDYLSSGRFSNLRSALPPAIMQAGEEELALTIAASRETISREAQRRRAKRSTYNDLEDLPTRTNHADAVRLQSVGQRTMALLQQAGQNVDFESQIQAALNANDMAAAAETERLKRHKPSHVRIATGRKKAVVLAAANAPSYIPPPPSQ